jgi:hypothetical protein
MDNSPMPFFHNLMWLSRFSQMCNETIGHRAAAEDWPNSIRILFKEGLFFKCKWTYEITEKMDHLQNYCTILCISEGVDDV